MQFVQFKKGGIMKKKYKLFIRKYNFMKNDYELIEKVVLTNDIYHEIGYIYCTSFEDIKRIDYMEIKNG